MVGLSKFSLTLQKQSELFSSIKKYENFSNQKEKFTRLTGLAYQPRSQEKLKYLYSKILRLSDKLPKDYRYKVYMEQIICHRMSILKEFGDKPYKIQEHCNARLEIMISQVEAEYELTRYLLKSKPWEPLIPPPPGQWEWPPVVK